ncbi:hypothetical protein A6E25_19405, partial [Bacillus cereus]
MSETFHNLFIQLKPLDWMIENATVVIDTNVLLSAYQTKPITFKTVLDTLNDLSQKDRLRIPSHVVKEFAKNRPNRVRDLSNELNQHINKVNEVQNIQNGKKLQDILPAIGALESRYQEIIEAEETFKEQISSFRKQTKSFIEKLQYLQMDLKEYLDSDPILEKYQDIIQRGYFNPDNVLQGEDLEAECKRRNDSNIPPGYKDKGKDTNAEGDLLVYLQLLELQTDVIFITFDTKIDWVYQDSSKKAIGARRELVEEFYEKTGGKTFKIMTPADFIERYQKHDLKAEVKEDLEGVSKKSDYTSEDLIEAGKKLNRRKVWRNVINHSLHLKDFDKVPQETTKFFDVYFNNLPKAEKQKLIEEFKETFIDRLFSL